jgi:hypothetical protein
LGHCFGLEHAGLWRTTDGNPVSDSGTFEEYGDVFDTMSSNNDTRTDFNPHSKWWIGWIDDTQIQTVTNSGIYRVHRIDGPVADTPVALKVAKDSSRNYWITIRHNFTENSSMMHGAYIIWDYNRPHTYLINAGSPGGSPLDAALPIDQTLIDPEAKIAITPVAEGGEPPHEYLDVQISFGPPPIISAQSTAETVIAGQSATYTVQAEGNPLFQWECKPSGTTVWVPLEDNDTYSGSQTATLVVRPETLAMNGDQFRCVLTNASGGFNCTRPAVLSVVGAAPILEITPVAGGLALIWPVTGKGFVLETSSEPEGGDWVPVTDGIMVAGTNYVFMLSPDAAKAFFRLHK